MLKNTQEVKKDKSDDRGDKGKDTICLSVLITVRAVLFFSFMSDLITFKFFSFCNFSSLLKRYSSYPCRVTSNSFLTRSQIHSKKG